MNDFEIFEGGEFEYYKNCRLDENGNINFDLLQNIVNEKINCTKVKMNPGDLMIFRGKQSLHRVRSILGGERILVTLNFNSSEGISLSETSRMTFFGRLR
jgi:predicted 2-oxoglutarate/Fe(II)-dependent dioxygenase YbiX